MRKTYIVFLLFFIFLATEYIFSPKVEAYDNKITHPLLTEKVAELYNYIYEPDLTDEEIQSLMAGSTDEDTAPRWINHFYDPTTKLGWSGKRLGDIPQEDVMTAAILAFGEEPVSAVTWAQDQELQNSQYSLYQGNRTFDSAVLYYLEGKKQEAYYSLGYVLHLVEDMTVSAHTRQDTHFDMAPEIFEQILGVKLDKGEPYEKWVEENGDIAPDLMDGLKKNYQSICTSLESCLIYLAKFSNNNLFSQDSILDEEYTNPKVVKYATVGDTTYAYDKNGYLLFMSEENPYRGEIRMTIDNSVYWQNLSPAAILAGVEVVKYFHEQEEKAKNGEITLTRPAKLSFLKKIQTISTYGEFARLWKLASFASINPFSLLWGDDNQQDETQPISQSPNVLTDLGLTYGEAQERMDDLQELLDLLNNKEEGNIFELPSFEPPSLALPEPSSLELPLLEMPPLLQPLAQNQTPVNTTTYTTSGSGTSNQQIKPKINLLYSENNPVNKEIETTLSLVDLKNALYDVKISIEKDGILSDIYNEKEGKWKSSNYYIQEVFSGTSFSGKFKLRIKEDYKNFRGEADIFAKIRENGKTSIYAEFSGKINITEPQPEPTPTTPIDNKAPSVVFNLTTTQESLNFAVSFTITDNSVEGVSPSGLASYQFRWKQEGGEWQEDVEQAIAGTAAFYRGARDFIAPQDETIYYFQVKAKDVNGNESNWLPETPATTKIRTLKTILINEIQTDSVAGEGGTDDDWVELYNPYDINVSLAGWSIQKHSKSDPCSTTSSFYKKNFPDDIVIPAHGFYLIIDTEANDTLKGIADMTIGWSLTDNNTIYLVRNQDKIESGDDSDIIDKVGFGLACYSETSPALNPPEAGSIERKKLGQDTNDNSVDFRISAVPTPKSASPKVSIHDATEYSNCVSDGECNLTIKWQSLSQDIEFYQVQYKVNDGNWKDWLLHTTDTQGIFKASSSIFTDHIYYFQARAKDSEGNIGSWAQIEIDVSNPVVINEIALFGTNASTQDQWLELYNKSDKDIDLTGWRLSGSGGFDLELEGTIPLKGYLVFERNDDDTISDVQANKIFSGSLCYVYLIDKNNCQIDRIYGGWQEYNFVQDGIHYSMERISPYSFGYDYKNWVINDGQKINGHDRNENPVYGTPGQQNSNYQLYTLLSTGFTEDTVLPKSVDGITESPYILSGIIRVSEGTTLTIEPGVRMETWTIDNSLIVSGTLKAIGTPEEPIVFAGYYNPDNQPESPGWWLGIRFNKESAGSEMENIVVKNAGGHCDLYGGDFCAGIRVDRTSVSLKNSIIQNNMGVGLRLTNSNSTIDSVQFLNNQVGGPYNPAQAKAVWIEGGSPTIKNSYFKENYYGVYVSGGYDPDAMVEVPATPTIENNIFEQNSYPIWLGELSFPSFTNNQAVNNDLNGIIIVGDIKRGTVWAATDLPYIIKYNLNILPDAVLTIQPGVTVKFSDSGLVVQGTLKALGTTDVPIIFTSNSDQPGPGQWKGIYFTETSQNSELENVQVRYAGAFLSPYTGDFGAGIRINQSIISLRNSIIEKNLNHGIWLINSPSVIDSVQVLDNQLTTYEQTGGVGVEVQGGSPVIRNSSIAGNYFGLFLSNWYDADGNPVPPVPVLENTDYLNNNVPIFPPLPPLPPSPPEESPPVEP